MKSSLVTLNIREPLVDFHEGHWHNYAMAQVSWFLLRPQNPKHPYDHWLAIHVNGGTKARYDAGEADYAMKPYRGAGFEVGTFTKDLRVISETYNGDYFAFEEEFPAFSNGFRYYHTGGNFQADLVWRACRLCMEAMASGGNISLRLDFARFLISLAKIRSKAPPTTSPTLWRIELLFYTATLFPYKTLALL